MMLIVDVDLQVFWFFETNRGDSFAHKVSCRFHVQHNILRFMSKTGVRLLPVDGELYLWMLLWYLSMTAVLGI